MCWSNASRLAGWGVRDHVWRYRPAGKRQELALMGSRCVEQNARIPGNRACQAQFGRVVKRDPFVM